MGVSVDTAAAAAEHLAVLVVPEAGAVPAAAAVDTAEVPAAEVPPVAGAVPAAAAVDTAEVPAAEVLPVAAAVDTAEVPEAAVPFRVHQVLHLAVVPPVAAGPAVVVLFLQPEVHSLCFPH